MISQCRRCSSHAINPTLHSRQPEVDLDLCDVCYWKQRAVESTWYGLPPHSNGIAIHVLLRDRLYSKVSLIDDLTEARWQIDHLGNRALAEIIESIDSINPTLQAAIDTADNPSDRAFLRRLDDGKGGIKPFIESIDPGVPIGTRRLGVKD